MIQPTPRPSLLKKNNGYSLLELGIVLIILSLLVISVLAGQNLIKAAGLRAVVSEIEMYTSGYNTFNMKYNSPPGDMPNAFNYFGTDGGCTNADANTAPAGCNGNGDKRIGGQIITEPESLRAHQHLSLSEVIPSGLSGVIGGGIQLDVNSPLSSYGPATTFYFASDTMWNNYKGINGLVLGGIQNNGWDDYRINVQDAYYIDAKLDDGLPYTGRAIGYTDTDGRCVTNRLASLPTKGAERYLTQNVNDTCSMRFGLNGVYK